MRKIILASTSKWRREILEKSRIPFTIEASDYVEDMSLPLTPKELVETLAVGKAEAVAVKHTDAIIIGADTVAEFAGRVIGKAKSPEDAISTLTSMSGHDHFAHTGYCIIDAKSGQRQSGVVSTRVFFRNLSESEILAYVRTGEPMNAAGCYTIQNGAAGFISRIEGDFYAVVGFPLATILEELKKLGVTYGS